MNINFPTPFKFAISESKKSTVHPQVGAVIVTGKSVLKGHNKDKTHPKFANPSKHIRKSLHAELDCILKSTSLVLHGDLYVYREVNGLPALARPCEHCMNFLKEHSIDTVYYSIPEYPYWKEEKL